MLPKNNIWRERVLVRVPLTPNALNGDMAGIPEYNYVYIEPGSYEIYKKTGEFPDGTIMFKELQLTLPQDNPDGSRTEQSERGNFPGAFNGADVTVKDAKRYADTGRWGYDYFNYHEPKAPTATAQPRDKCAWFVIARDSENSHPANKLWGNRHGAAFREVVSATPRLQPGVARQQFPEQTSSAAFEA
jgi:Cytochrome P460